MQPFPRDHDDETIPSGHRGFQLVLEMKEGIVESASVQVHLQVGYQQPGVQSTENSLSRQMGLGTVFGGGVLKRCVRILQRLPEEFVGGLETL